MLEMEEELHGMNTGIGPTAAHYRGLDTQDLLQSRFQCALHGNDLWLYLPAMELGAFEGDLQKISLQHGGQK